MLIGQKLAQHIREYYESQELSADSITRLKERIGEEQRRTGSRRGFPTSRWPVIAASLLVALAAAVLVMTRETGSERSRSQIAQQAAREHNLKLEVEVSTADYAEIRARMDNLDFSPVEPEAFKKAMNMRLLGARYSSLHGQPAVQLKLADQRGEICTLIEARPVDRLGGIVDRSRHQVDGLLVDIWREKGLVMVLTRPIA